MRRGSRRDGAVLVTVLLLSVVTWLALSASLIALRLQYEVAVAARDHGRASIVALRIIDTFRARDWWASPLTDDEVEGGTVTCTWSVAELDRDEHAVRFEVSVTIGRAQVTLDATVHRSSRPMDDRTLLARPLR